MSENMQPNLVLGTAGHIDHGKSSLVMALTGTDPDRLSEEKKRGITIELGFARLDLGDGRSMGVVDVPGHEKFVRQMIAGATGIDVALLVIAADDGIMPQTLEHIAVLQTLGVPTCVVALTKIDLVDADWAALAEEEVRAFLSNTSYANAPIVPVSSRTGEGVEEVRAALAEASKHATALHRSSALRQPVDRVFTIKGAGTVITGTLWSGTAHVGDSVEILPSRRTSRIRSIQMHDQPVEEAPAGNRVALNLVDVKTDEVSPGDFLATPGLIEPTIAFDAQFTYLDTAKSGKLLESGVRMHVAHGTKEVLGRVLFANGQESLEPGQSAFAQIRLEEELPVSLGDRFIVRTYSPVVVAGGGQVLMAHPR
ncbi:MAG: selenocysteine-specific translation elongation factor, partial [Eggerthellaceae bacterium]|nr:selenocysteine-specific translation elongation factor [Eggerthellaceae bacterium]